MSGTNHRPRFGVDLDGVCFGWDLGACIALRLRGVDVEIRESYSWGDLEERVSPEDWAWVWGAGVREVFSHAPAFPATISVLVEMQEILDLVVITHRPREVIDITLRKLAEQGLRPVSVHHVQGRGDKHDVAPDCVGYVDDKVENCLALATNHDVPVFLPRRPWNAELWDALNHDVSPHPENLIPYDDPEDMLRWACVRELTS